MKEMAHVRYVCTVQYGVYCNSSAVQWCIQHSYSANYFLPPPPPPLLTI